MGCITNVVDSEAMTNLRRILSLSLLIGILSLSAFGQAHCPLSVVLNSKTTATATQLIASPTSNYPPIYINGVATANPLAPSIHICSVSIHVVQTATPANFGLVVGAGTNCATNQANLTPQWVGNASVQDKWDMYYGEQAAPITPTGTAV